jgi:hypothetical protein
MFDINPVAWYESAISANLERELAEDFLSAGASCSLTALWKAGSLPVIGKILQGMASAMKISLCNSQLFEQGKLKLTYPKDLDSADLDSLYVTVWKEKK